MEYFVPFPVAYIFPPKVLQVYGEVFVFLLQIRRAKAVLDRILVRGAGMGGSGGELKAFYAFRGRLSWFIKYASLSIFQFGWSLTRFRRV